MRSVWLLVIAAAAFGQPSELKNPRTSRADVDAGAKIFRSHCAECHGLNGEGGRGPRLTTGVFFHGSTDADLFGNISDGIPGTTMPGVFFSPEQVWQIVAYVRTLSQQGSRERPAGDAARGAILFQEKQCATCHLVRGEGGVQGPDLSVIGSQRSTAHLREAILDPNADVMREYWTAKITLATGSGVSGFLVNQDTHSVQILDLKKGLLSLARRDFKTFDIDKSSSMPSYKGQLTEAEVTDLVAYLWSLKRQGRSE